MRWWRKRRAPITRRRLRWTNRALAARSPAAHNGDRAKRGALSMRRPAYHRATPSRHACCRGANQFVDSLPAVYQCINPSLIHHPVARRRHRHAGRGTQARARSKQPEKSQIETDATHEPRPGPRKKKGSRASTRYTGAVHMDATPPGMSRDNKVGPLLAWPAEMILRQQRSPSRPYLQTEPATLGLLRIHSTAVGSARGASCVGMAIPAADLCEMLGLLHRRGMGDGPRDFLKHVNRSSGAVDVSPWRCACPFRHVHKRAGAYTQLAYSG